MKKRNFCLKSAKKWLKSIRMIKTMFLYPVKSQSERDFHDPSVFWFSVDRKKNEKIEWNSEIMSKWVSRSERGTLLLSEWRPFVWQQNLASCIFEIETGVPSGTLPRIGGIMRWQEKILSSTQEICWNHAGEERFFSRFSSLSVRAFFLLRSSGVCCFRVCWRWSYWTFF